MTPSTERLIELADEQDCWNCGGEGYVYGCSWDWQCSTWDGDSCLCTRRCDICNPPKPNPELQAVLTDALAADIDKITNEGAGAANNRSGDIQR